MQYRVTTSQVPHVAEGNTAVCRINFFTHANANNPVSTTGSNIYFRYDPTHPMADENGLVRITNPNPPRGDKSKSQVAIFKSKLINPIPPATPLKNPGQIPQPTVQNNPVIQIAPSAEAHSGEGEILRVTNVQVSALGSSIAPPRLETKEGIQLPLRVAETSNKTEPSALINVIESLKPVQLVAKQGTSIINNPQITQVAVQQKQKIVTNVSHFDAMIAQLHKNLVRNPDDGISQLALRSLYLVYGMNDKALGFLPSLPREKQTEAIGLTRSLHLAAQSLGPANQSRTDLANEALVAWREQGDRIAARADLVIANFRVCRDMSVKGFGLYEVISDSLLKSGEPRMIQIYCELQNFKSQLNSDGKYVSKIAAQVTLYNSKDYGKPLTQLKWSEIPDEPSYNRRRDFFIRGPLQLPKLLPGQYELVIEVEDKKAAKTARPGRLQFEVK
ncbi:MAG: hypothetical protein IID32_12040 [Planctomycetes bacterium]|nr:hypothetical protein [Planctomycetota bacterium]